MAEENDLAALTGFTESFYRSVPELWKIYKQGQAGGWTPDRLLAAMRGTKWFKKNTDAARELHLLKTSNPSEYHARVAQARTRVESMARQMGTRITGGMIAHWAEKAIVGSWTDEQLRAAIGSQPAVLNSLKRGESVGGVAGAARLQIQQMLADNGVKVSTRTLANWMQGVATGVHTIERIQQEVQKLAISQFPAIKERIMAGESVRDIAAPYIERMSALLEIDPSQIGVQNSNIKKALSKRDKDGRVVAETIWEFEDRMRRSGTWQKTNNAREEYMTAGREVASMMGLV